MIVDWMLKGKPSLVGACIGAVVGLVAITPAAGFVSMQSAVVIGLIAGAVANYAAVLRAKSGLDDSLDVVACHGVGGTIGLLMAGLCSSKAINSAGADGGRAQLFIQLKAVVITAVFCFVGTVVILKIIDAVFGLRPADADEARGLDMSDHNEKAMH